MRQHISDETSRKIELLAFIGACLVSLLHLKMVDTGAVVQLGRLFLRETLGYTAVPFFFAVSGYFLAGHIGEKLWWRTAVIKRIFSLGVPYAIWTFVSVVLLYVLPAHWLVGWKLWGFDFTRYPVLPALWYVRCLFILVLISPVLDGLLARFRLATLGVFFVGMVSMAVYRSFVDYTELESGGILGFLTFGLPFSGLFYFSAGIFLRKFPIELKGVWPRLLLGTTIVLIALRVFMLKFDCCRFPFAFLELIIPFVIASAIVWVPSWPLPQFLRGTSFPIYLIHTLIYFIFWFTPSIVETPLVLQYALSIIIPILMYNLLKRCFPRIAWICFGGR